MIGFSDRETHHVIAARGEHDLVRVVREPYPDAPSKSTLICHSPAESDLIPALIGRAGVELGFELAESFEQATVLRMPQEFRDRENSLA